MQTNNSGFLANNAYNTAGERPKNISKIVTIPYGKTHISHVVMNSFSYFGLMVDVSVRGITS